MIDRPIADDLVHDADEERLHDTWRGARERMSRRSAERLRRVGATVVVLTVSVIATVWAWPTVAGPLRHESGASFHAAESVAEPRTLHLADRSTIELGVGARIEPRRNDAQRLELHLVRGRARFEVTPGGPREWVIGAGLATIRVLGTAFVVDRSDHRLLVEVEHGRVRVEGEAVPGHRQVLNAGERLALDGEPALARAPEPAPTGTPEPTAQTNGPVPHTPEPSTAPPTVHQPEPTRVTVDEPEEPTTDPATLLRQSDAARRDGRFTEATAPLEAILRDHPDHPEAPLAAITLARLQLGPLDDPRAALGSLRLARRLGVPRLFDAEVCSSMALVLDATGDGAGARSEAEACLGRHGAPPNAERLRQLLDTP